MPSTHYPEQPFTNDNMYIVKPIRRSLRPGWETCRFDRSFLFPDNITGPRENRIQSFSANMFSPFVSIVRFPGVSSVRSLLARLFETDGSPRDPSRSACTYVGRDNPTPN